MYTAIVCVLSGIVKGNTVSNGCHRMMWMLFAAAGGILLVIVFIWSIVEAGGSVGGVWFYFFFYYYTALSLPSVVASASFKVHDPSADAANNLPQDNVTTR